MRKVLCLVFCVMAMVLVIGCGPNIVQDVQLSRVAYDGQCIYQVRGLIMSWGDLLYAEWTSGVSYAGIEKAKADQFEKLQDIIDSGCLDPLL